MQTRLVDPAAAEQWEAMVARCGGHALHLPAIHRAEHDPSTFRGLVFESDGELVACALALDLKPGRLGRLRGRPHVLLLPTAPALVDPDRASDVCEALFRHAQDGGAARVVIQPAWGNALLLDERLARWRTGSITEFILDLGPGYDAVLAGMHKIHRKNIRRAARAGIEVVEDSSVEGLLHLRDLQRSSSARAESKTEGFAVQDAATFRALHEHVYGSGPGSILFARINGEPVAALAWVQAAGRAQTVRSGSLPQGYEARAMYLLHDELIRRCCEAGIRELNIGGVPTDARNAEHAQSGLHEFKQGFGGRPELRHALDLRLQELIP